MNERQAVAEILESRELFDVLEGEQGIWDMVHLDPYPIEVYNSDNWYIGTLDASGNFHPQEI